MMTLHFDENIMACILYYVDNVFSAMWDKIITIRKLNN